VLDKKNDIATIKSSNCENDSNKCESRFVKSKETRTSKKIEQLNLMLSRISNNCFWICVKSRITINSKTNDIT